MLLNGAKQSNLSFCFMIISQKMSNNNEFEENLNETHCSRFFQGSCPSNGFIQKRKKPTKRSMLIVQLQGAEGTRVLCHIILATARKISIYHFIHFVMENQRESSFYVRNGFIWCAEKTSFQPMEDTECAQNTFLVGRKPT